MYQHAGRYFEVLSDVSKITIGELSHRVGIPEKKVCRELSGLISANILTGVYPEADGLRISEPSRPQQTCPPPGSMDSGSQTPSAPVFKTVICSGCGAANRVAVGSETECEYCGNTIQG